MMVIKGTVAANTFGTHLATVVFNMPATHCTWAQVTNSTGGYDINNAVFVHGEGTETAIVNPELGFIGKSGRFVQITA